jgi:hypothetical protein
MKIGFFTTQSTLLAILLPLLIVLSCNVGLLLDIENFTGFNVINFLSEQSRPGTSGYVIELAIGISSGTLVFFAFAQLIYSFKQLPTSITTKYVISKNRTTWSYIFFQLNIITILCFFSINDSIYNINWALSLLFFVLSVLTSFLYFRWLVNLFKDFRIYNLMVERIDLDKLLTYDIQVRAQSGIIQRLYQQPSSFPFSTGHNIPRGYNLFFNINSKEGGTLQSINIDKLETYIKGIKQVCNEAHIVLNKNVGNILRDPSKVDDSHFSVQLILFYIPELDEGLKTNLKKALVQSQNKIRACFDISYHNPLEDAKEIVNDLIVMHRSVATEEKHSLSILERKFNELFYDFYSKSKDISDEKNAIIKLCSHIVNKILDSIQQCSDKEQLESYLSLIYPLSEIAVRNNSQFLHHNILGAMGNLFYRLRNTATSYNPVLATVSLYYREIGITKPLHYYRSQYDLTSTQDKQRFFSESIDKTIELITSFIFNLCRDSYTMPFEKMKRYLHFNLEDFIGLFSSLNTDSPYAHIIKLKAPVLQKDILKIAVFIFKEVMQGRLPKTILFDTVYPLVESSGNILSEHIDTTLNRILHRSEFHIDNTATSRMFRMEDIRPTNSPVLNYNADKFWIYVSLYRKRHNLSYLPNSITGEPNGILYGDGPDYPSRINELLRSLGEVTNHDIAKYCNLLEEEAPSAIDAYKNHLIYLQEENARRINDHN